MPDNTPDQRLRDMEDERDNRRFHDLTRDEWDSGTTQGPNSSSSFGVATGGFAGKGPRGWKRSDEAIFEDICGALERNSDIDASEITVEVKDHDVTLSGTVPTRRMKRLAEDIAENLPGVRDVHNRIKLQDQDQDRNQ